MLSPKTQTNLKNAKSYFEEHLAIGDYYTEAERVSGEWIGVGAEMLGLSGSVQRDEFVALCENAHPQNGERLTQRLNETRRENAGAENERNTANRRVFFDFTFSPPKSVSIVALVGGDQRVVRAHGEAVKIAMQELEQFAATRIRQAGNNADRATGNIIAALFQHDTSRALDPHLHTHCIVFNATHDATEGRWKALQNSRMLVAQKYVENVYYHELARALRSCGYTLENSRRGDFRVVGVSPELCEKFSKRHREIDAQTREFLARKPQKTTGNLHDVREYLAHTLRSRKIQDLGPERLTELWKKQLTPENEASLRVPTAALGPISISGNTATSWAEEHLFDRRSVVREHELWRHALEFARGSGLTLTDLKRETASRDYLREADGKLTRKDVLGREWRIVQMATEGAGKFPALARLSHSSNHLADDQQKAFERIVASRDFVTLFRGGAGTGKSYVLHTVQETVAEGGRETVVLAPQRQQVIDLERDGLTNGKTVAEFLQNKSISDGAILIVDEAGQIGGRQMLALLELAEAHGGRVILSGDTRQHGPIQASDALRAIERYSGLRPAELNVIRRQDPKRAKAEQERQYIQSYRGAVKAAAEGDTETSFSALENVGAIVEGAADKMHESLVRTYLDFTKKSESALVVSQTRADVRALNDSIRAALRSEGRIEDDGPIVSALESIDLTAAQKLDPRFYPNDHVLVFNRRTVGCNRGTRGRMLAANQSGIIVEVAGKIRAIRPKHADHLTVCTPEPLQLSGNDRLQLKANGKAVGGELVANGEVVTVRKTHASGKIALQDGRILPADYRQFARGYAVTSYGSQGKTVDHVLLSDSAVRAATNAQQWYVTISRGRKSVQIFTPDKQQLQRAITRSGDRELALKLVTPARINRIGQQTRSVRRGREFARQICLRAMRSWFATFLRTSRKQLHETSSRSKQTSGVRGTRVLAP
jgi:conjugative relaxase-like TrwC/TraI family protein